MRISPLVWLCALAVMAAGFSGCVGDRSGSTVDAAVPAGGLFRLVGSNDTVTETLVWEGGPLEGPAAPQGPWIVSPEPLGPGPCTEIRCATHSFEVHADATAAPPSHLLVTVRVPPGADFAGYLSAWLETPEGVAFPAYGAFYGTRIAVPYTPGVFALTVRAEADIVHYEVTVQPYAPPVSLPGDQLPNLVTLPPRDIMIGAEAWGNLYVVPYVDVPRPVGDATGVQGCAADEYPERQALRCLRLSNGIANIGAGPLEVRISTDEAPATLTADGAFRQRIYRDDGTYREVPVGDAYLHPSHAHLHYQGLADYRLYEYDATTGTIGQEVGVGRKAGFCLVDEGPAAPLVFPPVDGTYSGYNCFFAEDEEWFMGLSPGWFDMYETYRSDQFIEITGVVDGVYALVSTVNKEASLHESNAGDNGAGALIRISDNDVETLGTWADWLGTTVADAAPPSA